MYETKPEIIGIYNNGVKGGGGGGGSGTGPTITIPSATLSSEGCVTTRNAKDNLVTSETVSVVPTQYFVQTEIARLDTRIDNAQGTVQYTPISSYVKP